METEECVVEKVAATEDEDNEEAIAGEDGGSDV